MKISADDVAENMKTVGASFPLSGTVYPKANGQFDGTGTLVRTEDRFRLDLTFPYGREAPASKGGIYTREYFWRFEGRIGDSLPLVVEQLDPGGSRHWSNGIITQQYEADTLLLSLAEFGEPSARPEKVHRAAAGSINIEESDEGRKSLRRTEDISIHALILNFPLIHQNGGTEFKEQNDFLGESRRNAADTFSGSFDGVRYGLVQRGDDLNVYLCISTEADSMRSVKASEELLTAFLTGLAFATGQHCWPYRVVIRRNGRDVLDKIRPLGRFHRTPLAPFSERIGFNAEVGNIAWDFADFLGKATRFFDNESALSHAASKALSLLRGANAKDIPGEITLSSLCVLLESLAVMIFERLELESKREAASFEDAKRDVKAWLERHPRIAEAGFLRLRNVVGSASLLRPIDKYRAVCKQLALKWEGLMEDAWDTWDSVRHKKLHAILSAEDTNSAHVHFTAVGRIAGAINILVLRLIGYSGVTRTSVFEDKHDRI